MRLITLGENLAEKIVVFLRRNLKEERMINHSKDVALIINPFVRDYWHLDVITF